MTTTDPTRGDRAVTLPQPNIPLLRKVLDWAEAEAVKPAHERLWRQAKWAQETDCGTAYCICGYAVTVSMSTAQSVRVGNAPSMGLTVNGKSSHWDDVGQRLLGLTVTEADDLFAHTNDIAEVRRVAEAIAERAGDRL